MSHKGLQQEKIIVVGSCNIDFFTYMKRLPNLNETVKGTSFVQGFGGKGANQAMAVGKLGGNVSMVGRVGDDSLADEYLNVFKTNNVDATFVLKTPGKINGTAFIMVSETGDNIIVILSGANAQMSVQDVQNASEQIQKAVVMVCQLEIDPEVSIKAMELCGGITILNAAPALEKFDKKILLTPTIFCVNELEAATFSGLPVRNLHDAKAVIKVLLKKGCNAVLLTMGAHGCAYASRQEPSPIYVKAPKVQAVDTTGAGDMFLGALAYLLAYQREELNMEQILKIACCAASEACTKPGTHTSYPGPEIWKKCAALLDATSASTVKIRQKY